MDTIELLIDEEKELDGVFAISLVESPAIESNFVALNKHEVRLKVVDTDKRIVLGIALKPNKKIFRMKGDYKYNVEFSNETVRKASELYLKNLRNNNTTVDHEDVVDDVSLSETWIVEDVEKDKTALYGIDASVGDWAIAMKVNNDSVWSDVKEGKYLGFSIEGIFDEKLIDENEEKFNKIKDILGC